MVCGWRTSASPRMVMSPSGEVETHAEARSTESTSSTKAASRRGRSWQRSGIVVRTTRCGCATIPNVEGALPWPALP